MIGRNILLKSKNLVANPGLQLVRKSHYDVGGIPGSVNILFPRKIFSYPAAVATSAAIASTICIT